MASIMIISGCLGTGKTTLSRALAQAAPTGLHFVTDTFYQFPAHPLDPTTDEAHTQNTTIIRAVGRAASAFVEGGYEVFLDGVIGPWFLPTLLREWDAGIPVEYVILRASLAEELARVWRRDGPATQTRVYNMHDAFEDLAKYEQHVIETTGRVPEEVYATCLARRHRQEFVLNTAHVVSSEQKST